MRLPPILFVGEAWGEKEEQLEAAFVGPAGAMLLRCIRDSKLIYWTDGDRYCLNQFYQSEHNPKWTNKIWEAHRHEIRRTNVFNLHPRNNELDSLCGPKSDGLPGYPGLVGTKHLRAEYESELDRLATDILELNPNLVVCCGGTPTWALSGATGIKKWRGTTLLSTHTVSGYKLLPCYHPSAVLHMPSLLPILVADLSKAKRENAYADIRRPTRDIWIEPTYDDIQRFVGIIHQDHDRCLSVDIETSGNRITCIGLGYPELAIVIPFDDERRPDGNYWPSLPDEEAAWKVIQSVLEDRDVPKLFQNGLYDIAFLWRSMRIKVLGAAEDTMLLHHALQPEMEKGLGFLGSVYADEGAWKHMRGRGPKTKTIKRDN